MSASTLESRPKPARCYAHRSDHKGVRFIEKGRAWQARVQPAGGRKWEMINLGLFTVDEWGDGRTGAEWAAARAFDEYVKRHRPGRDPWDVVKELQAKLVGGKPIVPLRVLPRWVRRVPGGFSGRCVRPKSGIHIDLPGPFLTPEAAYSAVRGWLDRIDFRLNPYLPPLGGVLEIAPWR